jgi:hypothetical protein
VIIGIGIDQRVLIPVEVIVRILVRLLFLDVQGQILLGWWTIFLVLIIRLSFLCGWGLLVILELISSDNSCLNLLLGL